MWIFSKVGFVSAVEHWDYPDYLMVRARVREDLENILKIAEELVAGDVRDIIEMANADYRFRVVIHKQAFSEVVKHLAENIDYGNFKNAVHDGSPRDTAYMEVWSAMCGLQYSRHSRLKEAPGIFHRGKLQAKPISNAGPEFPSETFFKKNEPKMKAKIRKQKRGGRK